MKRSFGVAGGPAESVDSMARALKLLSQGGDGGAGELAYLLSGSPPPARVFECKTCSRQFPSFQALGGHRASHKKPKLAASQGEAAAGKPRVHECSVCGLEFAIGQALGGHMRRHRAATAEAFAPGIAAERTKGGGGGEKKAALWLDLNVPPSEADAGCRRNKIFGFELVDTTPVAMDYFHRSTMTF